MHYFLKHVVWISISSVPALRLQLYGIHTISQRLIASCVRYSMYVCMYVCVCETNSTSTKQCYNSLFGGGCQWNGYEGCAMSLGLPRTNGPPQPTRRPESRVSMRAMSASVRVTVMAFMFSCKRRIDADLGMTITPLLSCQAIATCAAVTP